MSDTDHCAGTPARPRGRTHRARRRCKPFGVYAHGTAASRGLSDNVAEPSPVHRRARRRQSRQRCARHRALAGGKITFEPGGPGFLLDDGALSMKFPWWRLRSGRLHLEGRRLDAPAPPMRSGIPDGYGESGFQATSLIFPTPGCWEVTGRLGDARLTFVKMVERS